MQDVAYHYVGENHEPIVKMKERYAKPLCEVLARLKLLGYTKDRVRIDFNEVLTRDGVTEEVPKITFETLLEAFQAVNVNEVAPAYDEEQDSYLGDFFAREIFDRLCSSCMIDKKAIHHRYSRLGEMLVQFDPWARAVSDQSGS